MTAIKLFEVSKAVWQVRRLYSQGITLAPNSESGVDIVVNGEVVFRNATPERVERWNELWHGLVPEDKLVDFAMGRSEVE